MTREGNSGQIVTGRLVLEDRVVGGRLSISDGLISEVVPDEGSGARGPYVAPGFVDLHVHGWGGHDASGGGEALDGMARALLRHGVTAFLPTAVSLPLDRLGRFAASVRDWLPAAPADGAEPLGFNLEGPFLAQARRGAHDPAYLRAPASVARAELEPLTEGLRVMTVAPELEGALELTGWLAGVGVAVSVGHSDATLEQALAAYDAGARTTTHLFNAMSGVDHRSPGVAVAALLRDEAFVELIADGNHVHPALWQLVRRLKGPRHLMLVSDAIALAGTGEGRGRLGTVQVEVVGQRATVAGTSTLAGSVIALDTAVRKLVGTGVPLPEAVAAASRNPLALLGVTDRGSIAVGQRADLVELDDELHVLRVMRGGTWFAAD